tara:strand:- start:29 stop:859 length:831 start_codon:yes stop_codon:yes gene_type:complete
MILDPTDQRIRDEGFNFVPFDRYLASPFQMSGSQTAAPSSGIAAVNQPIIFPQTGGGGGDGIAGLGGKFGNLDLSQSKNFMKDVYSVDMAKPGAPMTASFKPEMVQGFLNPKTGQYQTLEGKNINHLGVNVKPAFAMALEALGFGEEDEELFDFPIGSIKGTFTGYNPKSNIGILEVFKKNKERAAELKRMQEEAEAAAAEKAQRAAMDRMFEQGQYDRGNRFDGADTREEYDRNPTGFSGSSKDGGIIGYGGTSGTPLYQQFMDGGLADLVDIYD